MKLTVVQLAFLREMSTGRVAVGTLGKNGAANHRHFETDDGTEINQRTVPSLLRRGMLKVVHVDGAKTMYMITEAGRAVLSSPYHESSARSWERQTPH